jgi:hypothetical protein
MVHMQYILRPFFDEAAWFKMTRAEQEAGAAAYEEFAQALEESGALVGNYRPHPSSAAKTVRASNGESQVLKGTHAATKEPLELGGIYIIDVPTLEEALSWAARNPAAAYGCVEVRGVWDSGL